MRLHKELDPQLQPVRGCAPQLAADGVAEVDPQVLTLGSCVLEPEVVTFYDAQVLQNLEGTKQVTM